MQVFWFDKNKFFYDVEIYLLVHFRDFSSQVSWISACLLAYGVSQASLVFLFPQISYGSRFIRQTLRMLWWVQITRSKLNRHAWNRRTNLHLLQMHLLETLNRQARTSYWKIKISSRYRLRGNLQLADFPVLEHAPVTKGAIPELFSCSVLAPNITMLKLLQKFSKDLSKRYYFSKWYQDNNK